MGKNKHKIKIYEKCLEENFVQVIMVLQQSSHHKPTCIKQVCLKETGQESNVKL